MDDTLRFGDEGSDVQVVRFGDVPVAGADAGGETVAGEGGVDNPSLVPADWRQQIEKQCRAWLEVLDEDPAGSRLEPESALEETPDIYSFYAELCAVRHEFRKQSRRTTDGLSRFGGILDEFEETFTRLLARLDRAEAVEQREDDRAVKREFFLPLVDIYDRFLRLEERLAVPPPMGLGGRARRQQAWAALREGFSILRDHFTALLRQSGVEGIVTVGQLFDPRFMTVVEVEETDREPADMVLAELAAGYHCQGQVLKLAEVKVAKGKQSAK